MDTDKKMSKLGPKLEPLRALACLKFFFYKFSYTKNKKMCRLILSLPFYLSLNIFPTQFSYNFVLLTSNIKAFSKKYEEFSFKMVSED